MRLIAILILVLIVLLVTIHTLLRHKRTQVALEAKKAMYKTLEKKSKNGDLQSLYRFAELYYEEDDEDYYPLIFKWVSLLAAYRKDPAVWLVLGDMLSTGYGTEKDLKRALSTYEQALSADILSGKNSNLSREAHNYLEKQIILLRRKLNSSNN
ncbi:MAG: hypothetical protein IKN49_04180 [Elusimicrobiaceae bacterium]|nr:hypothetical protein [Elusimicrobiaceae bacterium]